jgi:hypothetical protein
VFFGKAVWSLEFVWQVGRNGAYMALDRRGKEKVSCVYLLCFSGAVVVERW